MCVYTYMYIYVYVYFKQRYFFDFKILLLLLLVALFSLHFVSSCDTETDVKFSTRQVTRLQLLAIEELKAE